MEMYLWEHDDMNIQFKQYAILNNTLLIFIS